MKLFEFFNRNTPPTDTEPSADTLHEQNMSESTDSINYTKLYKELPQTKVPYITDLITEYGIMSVPNICSKDDINTFEKNIENIPTKSSTKLKEFKKPALEIELFATSRESLLLQLGVYYKDKIKSTSVLEKRHLSESQTQAVLNKLATDMSHELLTAFKDAQQVKLTNAGLTTERAGEYIDWRLNYFTENNEMILTNSNEAEALEAPNFISTDYIEDFKLTLTAERTPEDTPIHTSAYIDAELEKMEENL